MTNKVYKTAEEAHHGEKTPRQLFKTALSRPWQLFFREPIVLLLSIYMVCCTHSNLVCSKCADRLTRQFFTAPSSCASPPFPSSTRRSEVGMRVSVDLRFSEWPWECYSRSDTRKLLAMCRVYPQILTMAVVQFLRKSTLRQSQRQIRRLRSSRITPSDGHGRRCFCCCGFVLV
jgi:hypothetical protein